MELAARFGHTYILYDQRILPRDASIYVVTRLFQKLSLLCLLDRKRPQSTSYCLQEAHCFLSEHETPNNLKMRDAKRQLNFSFSSRISTLLFLFLFRNTANVVTCKECAMYCFGFACTRLIFHERGYIKRHVKTLLQNTFRRSEKTSD